MLSWPPATTIVASPVWIAWLASATARRPEPQTWLTPQAGTSLGMPAAIEAWRAGILALGGGQHLAEDHFGDVLGRDAGLGERRLDRDPAELVGGGGGEGAEEGRRPGCAWRR